MKKAVCILLLIYLCSPISQAQTSSFKTKVQQEIALHQKAFAQRVIFKISRYFRIRGEVLPKMRLHFRGMVIVRKQLSSDTCIYEFCQKQNKLILAENEVRMLAGLAPKLTLMVSNKLPVD
jgi:hypothetical protein